MSTIYRPDSYGMIRPVQISDAQKVDKILKLKQKSGSDPWPVIEAIFKLWRETRPKEYQSYVVEIEEIKNSRKDKRFGTGKSKSSPIRYTLDIPQWVMLGIRMVYNDAELPMNKVFFRELAKRFPDFKIAEKS